MAVALLPHTPLLAPNVGKDHRQQLQRTIDAAERIATELYALQPSLYIILTPHGRLVERNFFCNVAETYELSLAAFGDFAPAVKVRGQPAFAYSLKRQCEQHHFPIALGTEPAADYGTTVPVLFLVPNLEPASLLAISTSDLSLAEHRDFGKILGSTANASRLRVAVIASVELAHRKDVLAETPTTKHPSGYDATILNALRHGRFENISTQDERTVTAAATCSHKIFGYLDGLLQGRDQQPSVLSYESPFGIGELAALFPTL